MIKKYVTTLLHENRKREIDTILSTAGGELRCFSRFLIGIYNVEPINLKRYHKKPIYSFDYVHTLLRMKVLEGVLDSLNKIPKISYYNPYIFCNIKNDMENIINMIDNKMIEIEESRVYTLGFEVKSIDDMDSKDIQRIILNEILRYLSYNNYETIFNSLMNVYGGFFKTITNIIQGNFDVCDQSLFSFDLFIFEDKSKAYEAYCKKSIFKDSYNPDIFESEVYSGLLEYVICKILYYEIFSISKYTMDRFSKVDTSYLIRLG